MGATALSALSDTALALDYPRRSVRLLVGYAAGGPLDTSARLIAQWLSERLGQQFIVENQPGAASNLAAEMVVRAPADGYTLLETSTSNAWNATLYNNLKFNFIRDIVPIAGVRRAAGVMEVHPAVPVTTVPEFIAYAKANPGKINMATGGVGSAPHLFGELFKLMTGVDLVTVNYRGCAAVKDVVIRSPHRRAVGTAPGWWCVACRLSPDGPVAILLFCLIVTKAGEKPCPTKI